jgi:hypothetical protein
VDFNGRTVNLTLVIPANLPVIFVRFSRSGGGAERLSDLVKLAKSERRGSAKMREAGP